MNEPLSGIENPHENDVLSGRGKHVHSHPGNKRFRSYVEDQKELYNQAPKVKKSVFAKLIVTAIRNLVPPGRFLKQDPSTELWSDIGDRKALDKTRQALREKISTNTTYLSPSHGAMTESMPKNMVSSTIAMSPEMHLRSILDRQLEVAVLYQWVENMMINGVPQHSSALPVGLTVPYQYDLWRSVERERDEHNLLNNLTKQYGYSFE